VFGGEGAHRAELHLFRRDLRAHTGDGFDDGPALVIELDQAGAFLRLPEGDLGGGEVVFGERELLFEEESALRGLGHRERLGELVEFLDVGVGDGGGALGVLVVEVDGDDAVLARCDPGAGTKRTAGVEHRLRFVDLLQLEALDQAVGEGAALQHADVEVVRVLDAERATRRSGQATELGEHGRGAGLILLRRQDLGGAGVNVREQERIPCSEERGEEGQAEDELLVLRKDDEEIQKADLVFLIGDW